MCIHVHWPSELQKLILQYRSKSVIAKSGLQMTATTAGSSCDNYAGKGKQFTGPLVSFKICGCGGASWQLCFAWDEVIFFRK